MNGLSALDAASAGSRGQAIITDIRAMRLDSGFCLVRVDTDAGISGYGECGDNDGNLVRALIETHAKGGGRLPPLLVKLYVYQARQICVYRWSG